MDFTRSRELKVEKSQVTNNPAVQQRNDERNLRDVTIPQGRNKDIQDSSEVEDMITVIIPPPASRRSPSVLDLTPPMAQNTRAPPLTLAEDQSDTPMSDIPAADTIAISPGPDTLSKGRRTRRGCLTCRGRRKKCDERKPNCENCRKLELVCRWKKEMSSALGLLPLEFSLSGQLSQHKNSHAPMSQDINNGEPHQILKVEVVDQHRISHEPATDAIQPTNPTQFMHPQENSGSSIQQLSRNNPAQRFPMSTHTQETLQRDSPSQKQEMRQAHGHQAYELPHSYQAPDAQTCPRNSRSPLHPPQQQHQSSQHIDPNQRIHPLGQLSLPAHPLQHQHHHLLRRGPFESQAHVADHSQHLQSQCISPRVQHPFTRSPRILEQPASQELPDKDVGSRILPSTSLRTPPRQSRGHETIIRDTLRNDRARYGPPEESGGDLRVASYQQSWPYRQISTSSDRSGAFSRSTEHSSSKNFALEDVAKSRMLRNAPYYHLDPTLTWDRKRCEKALERFKKASSIDSGMNAEVVRSILWQVFDPGQDTIYGQLGHLRESGTLSQGVNVEGDFSCSYGYNIMVCEGAYIDCQVFIDDAARVHIGARCWIGYGVKILTSMPYLGPGGNSVGMRVPRAVCIEDDVIVGQAAVIYPGVTLAKGSVVEPGSIIKQDYPSPSRGC